MAELSEPATRRANRPPPRRRGGVLSRLLSGPLASEALGLVLLALTALLALSLFTHSSSDPAPLFGAAGGPDRPLNAAGPAGAFLAAAGFQLLGAAAYALPLICLFAAWSRLSPAAGERYRPRLPGLLLLLPALAGLLHLFRSRGADPVSLEAAGGLLGLAAGGALIAIVGRAGAFVVLATGSAVGVLLATRLSVRDAWSGLREAGARLSTRVARTARRLAERRRRARLTRETVRRHLKPPAPAPAVEKLSAPPAAPIPVSARAVEPPAPSVEPAPAQLPLPTTRGEYEPPPLSLLKAPEAEHPVDERELVERARLLTAKLQEFGIGGAVVAIHPGPVITTFEFKPDAGIKYSRITGLLDDLALALKAEAVRIDRMPGRSTIGIEVPNQVREAIRIREILESEAFGDIRGRLPLALGKTIDGRPYATSLERMPHLLIAGATGSGKSVALNSMIASILFTASPEEVKFIFIDPKMLELGIYEDIPHLICPVVTDAARAPRVLRWATAEMTRRYELMFGHGVRNLEQFNRLATHAPEDGAKGALSPLPSIVVVIDELADLMMVSSREVEAGIQRLAQMARAVGIHLIIATQRPSVDVLTGVIKANFPSRIAFRVLSRTDSSVILDHKGAERLLGSGDMLFLAPGASSMLRIHGALMEEGEALRLIAYLKQQGKPVFNEEILKDDGADAAGGSGLPAAPPRDPLFEQAARLVASMGQASVSHLQRRLGLGYARAARLMDSLEAEGIVGPPEGSKPREVLVPPDYFDSIERGIPS